jgi:hypothetical protein
MTMWTGFSWLRIGSSGQDLVNKLMNRRLPRDLDVDCIHLAQDSVQRTAFVNTVMNLHIP